MATCVDNCNARNTDPECASFAGIPCDSLCGDLLQEARAVCDGAAGNFFACLSGSADECPIDESSDCRVAEDAWETCQELNNPFGCGSGNTLDYGSETPERSTCGLAAPCNGRALAIDCVSEGGMHSCSCSIDGVVAGTCVNDVRPECRGILDGCCRQAYFGL